LCGQLNQKNELLILGRMIPWGSLEIEFAWPLPIKQPCWRSDAKANSLNDWDSFVVRHLHNLSDKQVVRGWVENPYWQNFCGYDFLQWNFPINPSSLTRFRNRLGV
jgi:IS5 family transposase